MTSLLALLLLAAAPQERPQLLVMDLQHSDDIKPDDARTLTDLLTTAYARRPEVRALSGADLRNLIALEGTKQTAGCSDNSSCLADVAGALGARYIVFGRVSTLGEVIVVQLNLFDADRGQPVNRASVEVRDVATVSAAIPGLLNRLMEGVAGAAAPAEPAGVSPLALGGGVSAGAGVLALLGGGVGAAIAYAVLADTGYDKPSREKARAGLWTGASVAAGGAALALVGAGVLVAGLVE